MNAPADKTAKRLSAREWFARYGASRPVTTQQKAQPLMRAPADRVAVRA
ncbi:MAG: hypothetical protein R3C30_03785 [Hyphomonadaceae bacterium]